MFECPAQGCLNQQGTGEAKRKPFFFISEGKYPTKRGLSQRWLHSIGTGHIVHNFTFGRHKVVCVDHFPGIASRRT
ncbi:hypothetical protein HOLleu_04018 [Holothuria leucospilota]|uniref:THAP-type domain-containing protein n=1 Tax=Holothuria leucospilota TaxID=206669 RepID=A0A9Q1HHZ3_HOLLE|nr:hypothetical protein HOLleu_04018 [Holothuria leucospilota]